VGPMRPLPAPGDRIVVCGILYSVARVSRVSWDAGTARNIIYVEWDGGGTSRVYDHDEGDVWVRYSDLN
jgi:hypothetical protein